MGTPPWPSPPPAGEAASSFGGGAPPRPDIASPPPLEPPRRRRGRAVLAGVVAGALLLAAIGAIASNGVDRVGSGPTGQYKFLQMGLGHAPIRWDPCIPIHYQVNLTHAPDGVLADVREAIARVASATGDRFVYDGTTDRTADEQMGRAFQTGSTTSRWFPVLIAWVPHSHFDYLADSTRAAAFAMPETGDGTTARLYESGVVVVDAGGRLPVGFDGRYSDGVVLMHELGHVMGLAHVGDGSEVMWSPTVPHPGAPDLSVSDWGPGDLEGLKILGQRPCPTG
jgi:hypothetical protein